MPVACKVFVKTTFRCLTWLGGRGGCCWQQHLDVWPTTSKNTLHFPTMMTFDIDDDSWLTTTPRYNLGETKDQKMKLVKQHFLLDMGTRPPVSSQTSGKILGKQTLRTEQIGQHDRINKCQTLCGYQVSSGESATGTDNAHHPHFSYASHLFH